MADPAWPPESPDPPWPPESPDPPWLPELAVQPWVSERAPPWSPSVMGGGSKCQSCVPVSCVFLPIVPSLPYLVFLFSFGPHLVPLVPAVFY